MSEALNYSPKLREAAKEMNVILNNHDIAGLVILYDNHKGEYFLKLNTTQSVMHLTNGNELRFRSMAEDFGGDVEKQKAHTEYSVGMVACFSDIIMHLAASMEIIMGELHRHFEIERGEGDITPHGTEILLGSDIANV